MRKLCGIEVPCSKANIAQRVALHTEPSVPAWPQPLCVERACRDGCLQVPVAEARFRTDRSLTFPNPKNGLVMDLESHDRNRWLRSAVKVKSDAVLRKPPSVCNPCRT